MPVVKKWQDLPEWSKIKKYERRKVFKDQAIEINESYPQVCFRVLAGRVTVEENGKRVNLETEDNYFSETGHFTVYYRLRYILEYSEIMLMCGNWKEAHVGNFKVQRFKELPPVNEGTPANYYRNTFFDNHYHDFDEYWIVWDGTGVVQTEGELVEVEPGDCVCTAKGYHHDFPIVHSTISSIALETEPEGQKRPGHLWEQLHGPAEAAARALE